MCVCVYMPGYVYRNPWAGKSTEGRRSLGMEKEEEQEQEEQKEGLFKANAVN